MTERSDATRAETIASGWVWAGRAAVVYLVVVSSLLALGGVALLRIVYQGTPPGIPSQIQATCDGRTDSGLKSSMLLSTGRFRPIGAAGQSCTLTLRLIFDREERVGALVLRFGVDA